jgi:hypothetical protein
MAEARITLWALIWMLSSLTKVTSQKSCLIITLTILTGQSHIILESLGGKGAVFGVNEAVSWGARVTSDMLGDLLTSWDAGADMFLSYEFVMRNLFALLATLVVCGL